MTHPYPEYKPSGVEWLGNIPAHWEVKKLKYFAKICNGQDQKEVATDNGIYPIIGTGGIFGKANTYLHKGPSVILGRKGTIDKPQYIDYPFWSVDTAYYTDIFNQIHPRFFFYSCLTIRFDQYKYGSAVPSMTQEVLNQVILTHPPLAEQTAIADYLDRKTAQIDDLLTQKWDLINLLQEERAGLINDAVTQGLNARALRKDSGLPWLGKIPAHWEVKKLKYVVRKVLGGGTPSTTEKAFWDGDIRWVSPQDMNVEFISTTQDYVTELALQSSATMLIPTGSILVVVRSGILKHTFPVAINTLEVTLNQDMKALIPITKLSNQFLKWLLKGMQNFILTYCSKLGATVDSIETEALFNFTFAYPPLDEQAEIVSYLDTETARIDSTIQTVEQEITLLTEYRSALISEVVTGKVKVS